MGPVPSTLQQKVKIINYANLITVFEEEHIIASVSSTTPYVDTLDEAPKWFFQSLEFVNSIETLRFWFPRLSPNLQYRLKELLCLTFSQE